MNNTGSIKFLLSSYVIRSTLPSTLKHQNIAIKYSLDIDIKGAAASLSSSAFPTIQTDQHKRLQKNHT